jgi:hypothetical protein
VAATLPMNDTHAREIRRRRRDFIRAHHPDRGGDTDFIAAGLGAFDTEPEHDPGQPPRVVIIKRQPRLVRLVVVLARHVRCGSRPPRVR